jgi:adenylyltransferase/sulfurtransferase
MPKIALPTPLRPYADGADAVEATGATVGEALAELTARHPKLRRHLFDDGGRLRSFVNVYKNDEDVRFLAGEATGLGAGDTLWIVPSIAGGAPPPVATAPAPARTAATAGEPALSHEEVRRYSRHLIIPEVGLAGQKKLKQARVLCVGAGGLGSPLALYLAAAGVGTLGIVDFDVVDESNLQRQVLHGTRDVGRPKLASALARLRDLNPNVIVVPHETRLSAANALELFRDYDVVADGTDNFPTRYLVNDACVLLGKPNVYASIFRFEGQASVFWAERGPCYRCLYREPPPPGLVPSCAEGGVLGILPGLLGVIQATETIKLLLGIGEPLVGRLLLVDALGLRFRELKLRQDPNCVLCGPQATQRELVDYEQLCGLPQAHAEEARRQGVPAVSVGELRDRLRDRAGRGDDLVVLDVREPHEVEICALPGTLRIPLAELPENLHRLSSADDIVVHCKMGGRSAKAVELLQAAGFRKVWNLTGGIDRWAQEVDPSVPRY